MTYRRLVTAVVAGVFAALLAGIGAAEAQAPPGFTFTFDETGVYSWTCPTCATTSGSGTASVVSDPSVALGDALIFQLPADVVEGDVNVYDSDGATLSDGLRFMTAGGAFGNSNNVDATQMAFYSVDVDDGLPADTGLPSNWSGSSTSSTIENPDETFTWTASPNVYNGASVPEPASLAILGAGIAGLGWVRRRRRG